MREFHCSIIYAGASPSSKQHLYSLPQFISYDSFSLPYKHFIMTVSSQTEPQFYHQALILEWHKAMKAELDAMEFNHTWTVVPLPTGKHSLVANGFIKSNMIPMVRLSATNPD